MKIEGEIIVRQELSKQIGESMIKLRWVDVHALVIELRNSRSDRDYWKQKYLLSQKQQK